MARSDRDLRPEDTQFMRRAVELGRRGWGRVHPNPLVGCVLVREGRIVGEGWHAEFGGSHAEVAAIANAGDDARGSTAYVSLEPCRHHGKTPPCTLALRDAEVERVVFGGVDPGMKSGGGGRELADWGIEVTGPVLTDADAWWENPQFFHAESDRPWLALKLATSLDGKIAARAGERTPISGSEALEETHRLRAGFDAILVGTRTAVVDDPRLTVRGPVEPRLPPVRVILDAKGRTNPGATIFSEGDGSVLVVTTAASPEEWRRAMADTGAELVETPADDTGRLDLGEALRRLRDRGLGSVLCEGGGRLGVSLLRASLVDRLYLLIAPRFLGAAGVPAFPFQANGTSSGSAIGSDWVLGENPRRMDDDVWMALRPDRS